MSESSWMMVGLIVLMLIALAFYLANAFIPYKTKVTGGPLDLSQFNSLFVRANQALVKGNSEGLKEGIDLLGRSLEVAGDYAAPIVSALQELRCALPHHDRADTKGPWNRDLSGYGVIAWKNDLYDRDEALVRAWPFIAEVNSDLRSQLLGWDGRSS